MNTVATQDITFAVDTQRLVFDCEDGPIDSVVSVTVYEACADDTAQPIVATTGSALVDAVATTTTAAAGASQSNPTLLALASASGVATDRSYRVAAAGLFEDVEIVGLSGLNATTRNPMLNDYATGATITATRASIGLDLTWVSDVAHLSAAYDPNPRYRARWLVVVAGVRQVYDRQFDLVRYPARHGVTPGMIDARFPGWLDGLPIDRQRDQGRSLIGRAFQQLKMDLWQDGKSDTAFRNSEAIAELVITRAMVLRMADEALRGGAIDPNVYKLATDTYQQRYDGLIRAPFIAADLGGGGGASSLNVPQQWTRR